VDTAIPVGLMLNEILTNAYKHAFEPSDAGRIEISMTQTADGNEAALTVQDDGKGFSEAEIKQKESVGTTLVSTLASQIEGAVERENHNGTRVTVRFPLREERQEGEADGQ
jgi:two-component sensor histidine kinase